MAAPDLPDGLVEKISRKRKFYGAAADYFGFEGLEALCESGAGTGKSFSVMCKADYTARKYPYCRQLFARQTRRSMNTSILPDWRERVLFEGHAAVSRSASLEHQEIYVYPNGSVITLGGLENIDRILSAQYDRIYIFQCEESSLESWEKLISRLRNNRTPYHQITADVNPASEFHWLNQRFQDEGPDRKRFHYRHNDNPLWYDHDADRWTTEGRRYVGEILAALTGIRRERLLFHRWVAEEGVILEGYDPAQHLLSAELEFSKGHQAHFLHIKDRQEPVRLHYFTAGVDWGWHPDPGVISVWGYDSPRWHPEIRRYRVAEIYRTRWQREEWADAAESLWNEFNIRFFFCDRSDPEAINLFNLRITKHLGRSAPPIAAKYPTVGGGHRSDIKNGIDIMREGLYNPVTKHIRSFFIRDALREGQDQELRRMGRPTCTEQEIHSWVYQKNEEGKENREKPDPSCDEHGIDCWRMDEVGNFVRGREGHKMAEAKEFEPETYGALFKKMRSNAREAKEIEELGGKRTSRYHWQQRRRRRRNRYG
jgi:phage terminase large subunit